MLRPTRTSLLLAVAAATAVPAAAQRPIRTFFGSQAGAGFGRALATAIDTDGDGVRDLVVGEPNYALGSAAACGAVRLLSPASGNLLALALNLQPGFQFGTTVAGLGDMDGDGTPDFAGGAPLAGTNRQGFVRVASGRTGLPILNQFGEERSQFGTALCAGGDRNLDGRADLLVAAPDNSNQRPFGRVQMFDHLGAVLSTFAGSNNSYVGTHLTQLGDFNGDGQPEYAIGEPGLSFGGGSSGAVHAVTVTAWGSMTPMWTVFQPFTANDRAGRVVAAAGDTNGDGVPDVLFGDARQRVFLYSGANGAQLGYLQNAAFGTDWTLAGIGDWNGDGRRDFAVGVPTANLLRGQVFVYSTNPLQLLTILDGEPLSQFGAALAGLGDVDGDGRDDFAVGAPGFAANGMMLGRVTVHAYDTPATVAAYGIGCRGPNGTPALTWTGAPVLGTQFQLRCRNLMPNQGGFWLLGWSDTLAGTLPLPLDLAPFGMPGCQVLGSSEATDYFILRGNTATWTITLPSWPILAGLRCYAQCTQLEPTRPGGLVFSDGARMVFGNL
ncbi:MAG: FG-GAP repeat protein [Planctomycetes bacterium]|nr:FG-GAP repeat protein [Planctomycetota bacterium]